MRKNQRRMDLANRAFPCREDLKTKPLPSEKKKKARWEYPEIGRGPIAMVSDMKRGSPPATSSSPEGGWETRARWLIA